MKVTRFGFFAEGTSATGGRIPIDFVIGATGGTAGGTPTPVKVAGHTGAIGATGKENFSAEPTGGSVIKPMRVPPDRSYEAPMFVQLIPGQTIGLRVNNPSAAVNCSAWFEFEE